MTTYAKRRRADFERDLREFHWSLAGVLEHQRFWERHYTSLDQ